MPFPFFISVQSTFMFLLWDQIVKCGDDELLFWEMATLNASGSTFLFLFFLSPESEGRHLIKWDTNCFAQLLFFHFQRRTRSFFCVACRGLAVTFLFYLGTGIGTSKYK